MSAEENSRTTELREQGNDLVSHFIGEDTGPREAGRLVSHQLSVRTKSRAQVPRTWFSLSPRYLPPPNSVGW